MCDAVVSVIRSSVLMAYCLRHLVNIAIMTVTYMLTRNPVLEMGIFFINIKVALRSTKTINMTGYYFNVE